LLILPGEMAKKLKRIGGEGRAKGIALNLRWLISEDNAAG